MKTIKRYLLLASLGWVLSLGLTDSFEASAQYRHYEIKAGLVLHIAKFTVWTEEMFERSNNQIVLTIYGTDPFGNVIEDVLKGRTAHGRSFKIRRTSDMRELKGSHIVFIAKSQRHEVCKVLDYIRSFRRSSVITIGDGLDDFCQQGGMVRLNDNYTFRLNWGEMSKSGLQPDQRLLNCASQVVPTDEERCQ